MRYADVVAECAAGDRAVNVDDVAAIYIDIA
jgi:hypothetical protein